MAQKGIKKRFKREVETTEVRGSFVIVCEGEKTEPNYFYKFQVPRKVVIGTGKNTLSLVQTAIKEKNKRAEKYDQVWCVFDRDSFPADNFNLAFSLAEKNDIRIACSNEAFELWYILHFEYLNTCISRKQYIDKLDKLLQRAYSKSANDIFDLLQDKQPVAIRNAEKLLGKDNPGSPLKKCPTTTVHLLVEQLNLNTR